MAKDLTQSRLDRQNILNNELAIQEIQETSVVEAVFFEDRLLMTERMVASFLKWTFVQSNAISAPMQKN